MIEEKFLKIKQELKNRQAILVDVREKSEWQAGHIEDAIFMPLSELMAGQQKNQVDKHIKIYTYCRSGNRSFTAKPVLEALGYVNIFPLTEGFIELVNKYGFAQKTGD